MFKYGVNSGPYFPAFGLNTERYEVYRPEITPYLDTFYALPKLDGNSLASAFHLEMNLVIATKNYEKSSFLL